MTGQQSIPTTSAAVSGVDDERLRVDGQNETRRRFYLQAMGVDLYLPRQPLPGAKPSIPVQPFPFDDELSAIPNSPAEKLTVDSGNGEVVNQTIKQAVKSEHGEGLKPNQVKKLDIDLSASSKVRVNKKTDDILAAPADKKTIQFNLRVWRVSNQLLVIDSREAELALPIEALLRNIITALGYTKEDLSKSESLRWPLMRQANNQQSEDDARAMVQAFTEAQQHKLGFSTVLMFGDPAFRFSVTSENYGSDSESDTKLWQTFTLMDNCNGIALPSLTALLQDPSLKKNTWQCIKHLRRSPSK